MLKGIHDVKLLNMEAETRVRYIGIIAYITPLRGVPNLSIIIFEDYDDIKENAITLGLSFIDKFGKTEVSF